jgi:ribose-phosphate pyrophosphokinase
VASRSRREGADARAVSDAQKKIVVLGFPDYREPAQRVASRAGFLYEDIAVHRFPDGESLVRLPERLPRDVVLFTSLDDPNRRLIELEFAAATAKELGAKRLTLIAPYLCYMRQDVAFHPGEAVSQHIVGALLARHFDTVITVDPHLHRVNHLSEAIPVRRAVTLSAAPVIADWLHRQGGDTLLIGPDEESEQWVSAIAAPEGFDYGVARKQRLGDSDVRITLPDCAFEGRNVTLVDDVASTGHTLAEAARQISALGASSVSVIVTHALFVNDALQNLEDAGVDNICSTDSIRHETNKLLLDGVLSRALADGGIA